MTEGPFLVCHDYGMGGLWAFVIADSADDITATLSDLGRRHGTAGLDGRRP
jgi:hypothetical protein